MKVYCLLSTTKILLMFQTALETGRKHLNVLKSKCYSTALTYQVVESMDKANVTALTYQDVDLKCGDAAELNDNSGGSSTKS